MKTTDISSVANSTLQAMEKEFRKNGMGAAFHRHYTGNRQLVEAMVAMIVADHQNYEGREPEKKAA